MSEIIWEKWEEHYKEKGINIDLISRDGILNEKKYRDSKTSTKILFILKDTLRSKKRVVTILHIGVLYASKSNDCYISRRE